MVQRRPRSCRRGRCSPGHHGLSAKVTECAAADQMAVDVEGIVDGGIKAKCDAGDLVGQV